MLTDLDYKRFAIFSKYFLNAIFFIDNSDMQFLNATYVLCCAKTAPALIIHAPYSILDTYHSTIWKTNYLRYHNCKTVNP